MGDYFSGGLMEQGLLSRHTKTHGSLLPNLLRDAARTLTF